MPGGAVSVGYDHQGATQNIWRVNARLTSPRCCGGAARQPGVSTSMYSTSKCYRVNSLILCTINNSVLYHVV